MKDKDKFLDMLDDPDIIKKIRSIIEGIDNDNHYREQRIVPNNRYSESELLRRVEQCKIDCELAFQQQLNEVTNKYENKISQIQLELNNAFALADKMTREKEETKKKYVLLEKIYSIYLSFTEEQISWFDRILHADKSRSNSPVELIVWGTQKDNLVAFWEIATSHLAEIMERKQTESFSDFFVSCFSLYSETTRGKAILLIPKVGVEYDPLKYSKTADSKSMGIITEVIFPGYCIGNENNKPIVKVN